MDAPTQGARVIVTDDNVDLADSLAELLRFEMPTDVAVVVTHTRARRLYDRHGFAFVARRKRTTWNGAVIEVDVLERRV